MRNSRRYIWHALGLDRFVCRRLFPALPNKPELSSRTGLALFRHSVWLSTSGTSQASLNGCPKHILSHLLVLHQSCIFWLRSTNSLFGHASRYILFQLISTHRFCNTVPKQWDNLWYHDHGVWSQIPDHYVALTNHSHFTRRMVPRPTSLSPLSW